MRFRYFSIKLVVTAVVAAFLTVLVLLFGFGGYPRDSVSGVSAQSFAMPPGVQEGDVIRGPDGIAVYIVNEHGYRRHIFNPVVFDMYGHLLWGNIKNVDQATLDAFVTSDLYRADGDYRVYITDGVDEVKGIATKRWLDISGEEFTARGYAPEQVFVINPVERDYYDTGKSFSELAAFDAEAIARTNELRQIAGLPPVVLDEGLSTGAELHVRYLFLNRDHLINTPGVSFHDEEPGRPGYTEEGRNSGLSSNIATRNIYSPPTWAVDAWFDTFYHRIGMLRPGLMRVGIGFADHPALDYEYMSSATAMDVLSGLELSPTDPVVVYPAPSQRFVPTDFVDEIPDPLPENAPRPAGYVITVQFNLYTQSVINAAASLVDSSGAAVPFYFSSPEAPALAELPNNFMAIALIPVSPLQNDETYTVTVSALVDGVPYNRTWSFTTAP